MVGGAGVGEREHAGRQVNKARRGRRTADGKLEIGDFKLLGRRGGTRDIRPAHVGFGVDSLPKGLDGLKPLIIFALGAAAVPGRLRIGHIPQCEPGPCGVKPRVVESSAG